jgi:hypothetical protein
MSRDDDRTQPDPWVRVRRSQVQAMHEAATTDHFDAEASERAWGFWAGHTTGHDEGRREALSEVARETAREKRAQQRGVDNIPYVGRRWARPGQEFGARETFGQPQPGDYKGGPVRCEPEREREREAG